MQRYSVVGKKFLSTPSARRATRPVAAVVRECGKFLSTPSARRATVDNLAKIGLDSLFLSTPSARRATIPVFEGKAGLNNFYPRPPRGGRHDMMALCEKSSDISIHALREEGDVMVMVAICLPSVVLSTPSARRATPRLVRQRPLSAISIHALREEGDKQGNTPLLSLKPFLSTPSARRATSSKVTLAVIHVDFYPRPPRGGRHHAA